MTTDADREAARALRLRSPPPPVTRLSRRAMILLAGAASAALALAAGWGLRQGRPAPAPGEPSAPAAATAPAEVLASLPRDYAALPPGIPRLGPPLPGDLGRPLLGGAAAGPAARPPETGGEVAAERLARLDAARRSQLFSAAAGRAPPASASPSAAYPGADPVPAASEDPKSAFLRGPPDSDTTSSGRLLPAPPNALLAGAIIPAALVTGVRSDLPGPVLAQVTEDVFDSVTGRTMLIPRGSRLLGTYDHRIDFGQSRVLLLWTRLILPDGRSVALPREAAADEQGLAGLADRVDRHWRLFFGAGAVSTLLGVGAELGGSAGESELARALREGLAGSVNQAGQQLVGKALGVQPTLTVRPGFPVRVLLASDLVLEPYRSETWAR